MEIKTIEDAKRLFGETVFWNWMKPVSEGLLDPAHEREAELPLRNIPLPPAAYEKEPADRQRDRLLRLEHGEMSVDVARLFIATEDGADVATEADAEFIAQLPVIIPMLLRQRERLLAAAKASEAALKVLRTMCKRVELRAGEDAAASMILDVQEAISFAEGRGDQ